MQSVFEMSMMEELNYFLGLQIKQHSYRTFINQAKYTKDLLKKYNFDNVKPIGTPMAISTQLDINESSKPINQCKY